LADFLTASYSAGNSSKNLAALGLYSLCPVAIIGERSNGYRIILHCLLGRSKWPKKAKIQKLAAKYKCTCIRRFVHIVGIDIFKMLS